MVTFSKSIFKSLKTNAFVFTCLAFIFLVTEIPDIISIFGRMSSGESTADLSFDMISSFFMVLCVVVILLSAFMSISSSKKLYAKYISYYDANKTTTVAQLAQDFNTTEKAVLGELRVLLKRKKDYKNLLNAETIQFTAE